MLLAKAIKLWAPLALIGVWSSLHAAQNATWAPTRAAREDEWAFAPADWPDGGHRRFDPNQSLLRLARARRGDGRVVVGPVPPKPADVPVADEGEAEVLPTPPVAAVAMLNAAAAAAANEPETSAASRQVVQFGGAGKVRRREPIEAPVLDQDAWSELLVAVEINGASVADGAIVAQAPDGRIAARVQDLRGWRLKLDQDRIIELNGEPFYPLDGLPSGAEVDYDPRTLTLALRVPPEGFEATVVEEARPSALPPSRGVGGFLDYDAVLTAGDGIPAQVDSLFELGLFNGFGVFLNSVRAGDLTRGGERDFARLETTLIRDMPGRRATLRLGDSFTGGGALGRPVRFGGVQYATDFGTDPSFITYPVPTIGGLAEQQSVVDVFINNTRRATEDVPAGPFELDSLPVVTGAGEVQLRVTDLLGRERIVSQSYYVSPRLLKDGLSAFSYEVGAEREGFGEDSFDYGEPFVAATHRYGVTDALTTEGHVELQPERQVLGVGATGVLGRFGLASAGVVGSRSDDGAGGEGLQASLEYEYVHPRFRLGARTRYATEKFRQLGLDGDEPPPRRVDQLNLGFSLGDFGNLGLFLVNTEERDGGEDRLAFSGSYGVRLGPGSLLLNAVKAFDPEDELAVTATYAIPLAPAHSLSTTTLVDDELAVRNRVQFSGGRGASDLGVRYRLAAEIDDGSAPELEGTLAYGAPAAALRLDFDRREEGAALRAGVSGSIAALDGHVGLTRRIGRAFGLVSVPGFSDVPVYLENREVGRTDEDGRLLLPDLVPYLPNRVRIDATALPLDAEVRDAELVAVPYARSGVSVAFPVERQRTALATLLDAAGGPLPAGLQMASLDGRMTARVARDGLAYIKGVAEGPVVLAGDAGPNRRYRCELPHPLPDEPQAPLGEIRCEG